VIAGALLSLDVSFVAVLTLAAVVQGLAALASARAPALRFAAAPEERSEAVVSLSALVRWPHLIFPAVIVMAAFFIEGSMDVWSVIFLRRTLGASILGGAAGFAAFALAIAVGRAFAARILFGMGYRRTILVAGLGSLGSGLVAVLAPNPVVAGVAFLGLGFFLSAAAPAAFGVAGGATPRGGLAIAAVTTVGYAGFVFGPPVMGWLADAVSLRATMVALVVVSFGIVAVAAVPGRRLWKAEPEREVEYPAVP
jgi:fucose permease